MGVLEFSLGFRNRAARGVGMGLLGSGLGVGHTLFCPTYPKTPVRATGVVALALTPDPMKRALAVSESSELISLEFLLECLLDSAQFLNGSTDV